MPKDVTIMPLKQASSRCLDSVNLEKQPIHSMCEFLDSFRLFFFVTLIAGHLEECIKFFSSSFLAYVDVHTVWH